jgi:hypothetical protein
MKNRQAGRVNLQSARVIMTGRRIWDGERRKEKQQQAVTKEINGQTAKIYSEHGKVKGEKRKHARGYACGEEKDGCWYNRGQTDCYKQQKRTKVAWVSRGYPNNLSALSTLTSFEPGRLFFAREVSIENAPRRTQPQLNPGSSAGNTTSCSILESSAVWITRSKRYQDQKYWSLGSCTDQEEKLNPVQIGRDD